MLESLEAFAQVVEIRPLQSPSALHHHGKPARPHRFVGLVGRKHGGDMRVVEPQIAQPQLCLRLVRKLVQMRFGERTRLARFSMQNAEELQ
jgi:hypothetical protein